MIYRIGDFELDPDLFQLRRGTRLVKLEPKVFDVLRYLVERCDRVVTKDELLEHLWPGEFVSESVLPRCITAARKALDDDAARQHVIQTVHSRGYRFVAPVDGRDATAAEPGDATTDAARGSHRVGVSVPADESSARHPAPFVGRDAAMARLRARLADAEHGVGTLVLLVGEPGIGKTRTAEEVASDARQRGARVFSGRCHEGEGAPAFWPWVQILRASAGEEEPSRFVRDLGPAAADVLALAPELRPRFPRLEAPPMLPPEQARFRSFDAVTAYFQRAARSAPLMLLLDDLHCADKPSLLLLQFLVRAIRHSRLLVVGTYRDVEVRRHDPLADVLGELAREPHCERLPLRGLTEGEVARFIAATAGNPVAPRLAATVHRMTDGNPFFLGEIVQLLVTSGGLARDDAAALRGALPQGVRDAIGRRVSGLSEACVELLRAASVIGREFGVHILARVAETPADRVLELLDEAAQAGILAAAPDSVGRYAFTHALVRETLYDDLPAPLRVRLHRRVGEVIEETCGADLDPHLAALAHHFAQSAPAGDAGRAVRYGIAAAERATRLLAYEEAAGHYARTLHALDAAVPADDATRCEVLIALGDAELASGERERSRATCEQAAAIGRRIRRPDLLARAVLGVGGRGEMGMPRDERLRALLDEALATLDPADATLRARVLARLVGTAPYSESIATRMELAAEAVALAERSGDPTTLVTALTARTWAMLGPDHVAERLAVASDMLALAERIGDRPTAFAGHEFRFGAQLALGDVAAADREVALAERLAEEMRQPMYRWFTTWWRGSRALCDGRFDEAERLRREALALGTRIQHPAAVAIAEGQRLWLVGERTGLDESLEPAMHFLLEYYPPAAVSLRAGEAFYHAEHGDEAEAQRQFEALAAEDFRDLPRDEHWLVATAQLAEVACALHDRRRAAILYELLTPFAERNVVHDLLRAYAGSASHHLGLLAAELGRAGDAAAHFERALAMNARMGARPYVARTLFAYARALLARPGEASRRKATRLLDECIAAADEIGLVSLGERATALRPQLRARR